MSEKHYEAYLQSTSDDTSQFSSTKYLLPKYYYDGEKHKANELILGQAIQRDSLKRTAPMAFFFIDTMMRILKQKSLKKTAVYIENINT